MTPQASEHWGIRYVADACDRCPECCVTEPTACEKTSTESCYCTDPEAFLAMSAKSRMVDQKECIVVEQQSVFPELTISGTVMLSLGFLLGVLVCGFKRLF